MKTGHHLENEEFVELIYYKEFSNMGVLEKQLMCKDFVLFKYRMITGYSCFGLPTLSESFVKIPP